MWKGGGEGIVGCQEEGRGIKGGTWKGVLPHEVNSELSREVEISGFVIQAHHRNSACHEFLTICL